MIKVDITKLDVNTRVYDHVWVSGSYDYFVYKSKTLILCDHAYMSQVASFLLYLSNVEMGGETMFPYEVNVCHLYNLHCESLYRY